MVTESTTTGSSPAERIVSLRPCPFCGCEYVLEEGTTVECQKCLAEGGYATEPDETPAGMWNRRADDEQVLLLVAAARKVLHEDGHLPELQRAIAPFEQANARIEPGRCE